MAKDDLVISHWDTLVENFEVSPIWYYDTLRQAIDNRKVPGLSMSEVEYHQGGIHTAKRVYLRILRNHTAFDVCCAPYGTGVFFSWWLVETPLAFRWLYTYAILFAVNIYTVLALTQSWMAFFVLMIFGLPTASWVLLAVLRDAVLDFEDTMVQIPIFGWVYRKLFAPVTYYKIDTALMFQQAVHNAVLEAIDLATTVQGIRALPEAERIPKRRAIAELV